MKVIEIMTDAFSLLDKSIDDIEDLPGFATPTNGIFSLKFSTKLKEVQDKPCVEANFEVIAPIELDDVAEEENPVNKAGTRFSILFQIENEIALGRLKELMAPAAAHFNESNMLVLVRDTCAQEIIVAAKVTRRKDKKDPDKFYPNVSGMVIS